MRSRKRMIVVATSILFGVVAAAAAAATFREAKPFVFDPGNTKLVQSGWLAGIGCPTGAHVYDGTSNSPYTDAACPTGDPRDRANEGLLLAKTGPTNVTTEGGGTFFIGCNSPPAPVQQPGNGWLRLRWGGAVPLEGFDAQTGQLTDITGLEVRRISIVFDEGQDTGPDNFGLAVLDNIDVNAQLVGQGEPPRTGEHHDDDDDNNDGKGDHDDD